MTIPLTIALKKTIKFIDTLSEWTGWTAAWLVLLMVIIIVYDASMRKLFDIGSIQLQELQWHLFALIFLFGAAYTLKYDEHVRVDIFYQSRWMNKRRQAWVNLLGGLFLLIPFCLLIINSAVPFIKMSYEFTEGSPDPGGLPYRFLLKSAIPIGFFLLLVQGIAESLKNLLILLNDRE
jgi:TRAP-type mannitol/chloroaromatic compound transport system permease small subunit